MQLVNAERSLKEKVWDFTIDPMKIEAVVRKDALRCRFFGSGRER